jgi:dehydrogenase/reductase SDR family protein 12
MFGQFAATSQFYIYGRKHCTKTGWEAHKKEYDQPDILEGGLDLKERVFMVTGSNSGVGKEIAKTLASKGGSVYMLCRSKDRAEAARKEIEDSTGNSRVYVLLGDLGLEGDVRRIWQEFVTHRGSRGGSGGYSGDVASSGSPCRLDALVCNAGVLLNEKTLTKDGIEVTFATHFLFGTYLLGCLAMPTLSSTPDARLVVVSSGGMYNTAWPDWQTATSAGEAAYSGNLAYAYAKRGQVLLMERWTIEHPKVKCVSCHPGWTDTPAVDEAYGSQKKFLEPMRNTWEGSEGIVWLCVAPADKIESGAFFLDRKPRRKHLAGPFFTEGSFTKNTEEDVDEMIKKLGEVAHEVLATDPAVVSPPRNLLEAMPGPIDLEKFMGRWYVIGSIPTFADKGSTNNTEDYSYDSARGIVQISFGYNKPGKESKRSKLLQRAKVVNEAKTRWSLSPKFGVYLPLGIPYLILDCAEDYSHTIIGVPDRSYLWIMARSVQIEDALYEELLEKARRHGFDLKQVVKVQVSAEFVAQESKITKQ